VQRKLRLQWESRRVDANLDFVWQGVSAEPKAQIYDSLGSAASSKTEIGASGDDSASITLASIGCDSKPIRNLAIDEGLTITPVDFPSSITKIDGIEIGVVNLDTTRTDIGHIKKKRPTRDHLRDSRAFVYRPRGGGGSLGIIPHYERIVRKVFGINLDNAFAVRATLQR
jgi:hypothetical protein